MWILGILFVTGCAAVGFRLGNSTLGAVIFVVGLLVLLSVTVGIFAAMAQHPVWTIVVIIILIFFVIGCFRK